MRGRGLEEGVLLELEQGLLAVHAAAVAGEAAVRPDHAVARDHDRHRVAAVGQAHGARAVTGEAERVRDVAVRLRSRRSRSPAAPTRPAAGTACRRRDRKVEVLEVAREVRRQLAHRLDEERVDVVAVAASQTSAASARVAWCRTLAASAGPVGISPRNRRPSGRRPDGDEPELADRAVHDRPHLSGPFGFRLGPVPDLVRLRAGPQGPSPRGA